MRLVPGAAVLGFWLLWAAAVFAQPAFDPAQDLTSSLASYGARWPGLGIGAIASLAVGYASAALLLRSAGHRLAAVAAAGAAATTAGVAAVRISCPNGARGCSGPGSGRASPRPLLDALHTDLVVAFEVAFVVAAAALAVSALRRGRRAIAAASLAAAVASPTFLLGVQLGSADGAWQLPWITTGCLWLLLVAAAVPPDGRPVPRPGARAGPLVRP